MLLDHGLLGSELVEKERLKNIPDIPGCILQNICLFKCENWRIKHIASFKTRIGCGLKTKDYYSYKYQAFDHREKDSSEKVKYLTCREHKALA